MSGVTFSERKGLIEKQGVDECIFRVTTFFPIKENSNDSTELSICAFVLMDDVHFEIVVFPFDCVLRRRVEVKLKWFKQTHRAVWECQLELSISEIHLQTMRCQCHELSIWVVHVPIAIDFHFVVTNCAFVQINWTLFFTNITEWLICSPVSTILLITVSMISPMSFTTGFCCFRLSSFSCFSIISCFSWFGLVLRIAESCEECCSK